MILKTSRPYFYFLWTLRWQLLILAILAIVVGELDDKLYLFENLSLAIPAFLGTAIVISLAFRTNKAYNRWWEAKMIWEGIANSSRSWFRMVNEYLQKPAADGQIPLSDILIDRQIAWNYVLIARLREEPVLEGMEKYLSPEDLDFLSGVDNATQGILFLQSRDLKKAFDEGRISIFKQIELEETLRMLEAYMGKAERIKKTHFPVLYDMIIESNVYVFCIMMAYFVSDQDTIFEASIAFILSAIFLSLTKIAKDMQDPFEGKPSDTPMTAISKELERGARQITNAREIPALLQPETFFLN